MMGKLRFARDRKKAGLSRRFRADGARVSKGGAGGGEGVPSAFAEGPAGGRRAVVLPQEPWKCIHWSEC